MSGVLLKNFFEGLVLGLVLAYISYKKEVITKKAAVTSIAISSLIFLSGWKNFLILLAFFTLSTLLTFFGYDVKRRKEAAESSHGREWTQIIGAGGITILWSLINVYVSYYNLKEYYIPSLLALIASIAISNADTWAAEIGALSKNNPRLVYKPWQTVDTGISGGVTLLGEIASLSGSVFISLLSYLLYSDILEVHHVAMLIIIGWIGEVLDSLIGGLLQVKYYCEKCHKVTEKRIHKCGTPTRYYKGIRWIKNETTNFLSSLMTSIAIFLLLLL